MEININRSFAVKETRWITLAILPILLFFLLSHCHHDNNTGPNSENNDKDNNGTINGPEVISLTNDNIINPWWINTDVTKDFSEPVVNVNYYVDATNGNDTNDGISPATAWKSLGKVNTKKYGPGNKILLKRGETWAGERLAIGNSSDLVPGALTGVTAANTTLEIMTALLQQAPAGITYGTDDNPVVFASYGIGANPIVQNLHVNRTTGIYIHHINTIKNGTEYTTMIQYCNDITIEDYYTPGMYSDYSYKITLRRILSDDSQEHGIYICTQSHNFIIEDCIFRNCFGSGIQTNGEGMNNIFIHRCAMYDNGIAGYNDVRSLNVVFYRCVLVTGVDRSQGIGKAIEVQADNSGNKFYNCIIISKVPGLPAVGLSGSQNSFFNNIFYVQSDAMAGVSSATITSDYNCYYAVTKAGNVPTMNWGTSLTAWVTANGLDTHAMIIDPQFEVINLGAATTSWDLHLKSNSPVIDKGTGLGAQFPFRGTAPDLGAIETP